MYYSKQKQICEDIRRIFYFFPNSTNIICANLPIYHRILSVYVLANVFLHPDHVKILSELFADIFESAAFAEPMFLMEFDATDIF